MFVLRIFLWYKRSICVWRIRWFNINLESEIEDVETNGKDAFMYLIDTCVHREKTLLNLSGFYLTISRVHTRLGKNLNTDNKIGKKFGFWWSLKHEQMMQNGEQSGPTSISSFYLWTTGWNFTLVICKLSIVESFRFTNFDWKSFQSHFNFLSSKIMEFCQPIKIGNPRSNQADVSLGFYSFGGSPHSLPYRGVWGRLLTFLFIF